jgi:hypothetical protein
MERRQVALGRLIRRKIGIAPPILAVLAVAFSVFSSAEGRDARLLEAEGRMTEAEIVEKWIVRGDDDDADDYLVRLRFADARGQVHTVREDIGARRWNRLETGDTLPVRYAESDPSVIETREGETARTALWLGIAAAAMGAAALGLTARALRRAASLIRAARRGEVREARVTDHARTGTTINKVRQYRLAWTDATGAEGRSMLHPLDRLAPWPPGSVAVVYADPRTGDTFWEEDIAPGPRMR